MADRVSDFLNLSAQASAAGRTLGMTDDEVLQQLLKVAAQRGEQKSDRPTEAAIAEFLQQSVNSGNLTGTEVTAKDVLRQARRDLQQSARAKGASRNNPASKPTEQELQRRVAQILSDLVNSESVFEQDLRADTGAFDRDPNAGMPQVVSDLEGAGLEERDSDVNDTSSYVLFENADEANKKDDGGGESGLVSAQREREY